jgi:hypothetical protein
VAREHSGSGIAQPAQTIGGIGLHREVIGEHREAVVLERAREVRHVDAEDQLIADADGLVPGGMPGGEQELDRAVAEEVVIAVDQDELALANGVVAWVEEVPLHRRRIVTSLPFAALDDDRDRGGQQREGTGVVEMQMREDDARERAQVDLLGDVLNMPKASGRP